MVHLVNPDNHVNPVKPNFGARLATYFYRIYMIRHDLHEKAP